MLTLAETRRKLNELAILMSMDPNFVDQFLENPEQALHQMNIYDEHDDTTLNAWVPVPTASPLCIFKPTPTAPNTHANCPTVGCVPATSAAYGCPQQPKK